MELFPHQSQVVDQALPILKNYGIVYLVMEVRTGKTLTSLTLADQFKPKAKVLFLTKKKAVPSIDGDYKASALSIDLTVTNYESIHKLNLTQFDLFILDEAHCLGQYPKPGERTKGLKEAINGRPCILLSGTPTPESYSQIFHQLWVTGNSPFLENNFYRWADKFVNVKKRLINGLFRNDYSGAKVDLIKEEIGHLLISCTQADAGFSAEVEESFETIQMNDLAKTIYRAIEKYKVWQGTNTTVIADTPAYQLIALAQIAGGTIITPEYPDGMIIDDSKAVFIRNNFKGKRIGIYYRFKAEYRLLSSVFPNHTTDWTAFEAGQYDIFMSQIQSGREGISLKSADLLIMYNIDFSATSYWQVRARMQHRSKTDVSKLIWLWSDLGIEAKVYEAVAKKKNFTVSYYRANERKRNTVKNSKATGTGWLVGGEVIPDVEAWNSRSAVPEKRQSHLHRSESTREGANTAATIQTQRTKPSWL